MDAARELEPGTRQRGRDYSGELVSAVLAKDREALEKHIEYLRDIVELRDNPGFLKLVSILSRLYWEAAERNMEEGGSNCAHWAGYRKALKDVVDLADTSIDSFDEHRKLLAITERSLDEQIDSEQEAASYGFALGVATGDVSTGADGTV